MSDVSEGAEMSNQIVTAARWLAVGMVLSSLILVYGAYEIVCEWKRSETKVVAEKPELTPSAPPKAEIAQTPKVATAETPHVQIEWPEGMNDWLEAFAVLIDLPLRALGIHFVNEYSADPNVRIRQMLQQSEDLREINHEWQRIWFTDHLPELKTAASRSNP
jgi:hypothetical protein